MTDPLTNENSGMQTGKTAAGIAERKRHDAQTKDERTCSSTPRVGDEGQRYVVSVYDENRGERMNLYYTDDARRAGELATNAVLRPSWTVAWVTDRKPGT